MRILCAATGMEMDTAYVFVGLLGLLTGGGELLNRYKDEPVKALFSIPALVYVIINVLAALLGLKFIDVFQWIADDHTDKAFLLRVLTAGVGSMTLFRSAVFNARIGDKDVGIGLSGLLALFLDAADREVDRSRAKPRAELIVSLMNKIDFGKADAGLPSFCMALMQNVSANEQRSLGNSIAALRDSPAPNEIKSAILGLTLLNVVGPNVLATAVNALRGNLTVAPEIAPGVTVPGDDNSGSFSSR